MSTLLKNIRAACKAVSEKSRHVKINTDYIPSYINELPLQNAAFPTIDSDYHYVGHGDDTVAFFLTLDSINFGSGYFPYLRKRPGKSGYFTIAGALTNFYQHNGPFSADELVNLNAEDCAKIFGQDTAHPSVFELMGLFAKALNDLGGYLISNFQGSFTALVKSADSSASNLVQILIQMPFFNDVALYDNFYVPFYKRAQLTASDLYIAFDGHGLGYFNDLDHLTIFADNLVPHVLRIDNILIYEDSLIKRIEGGERITAGSAEEIEIRACAVHAVEMLKAEILKTGRQITSSGLDYVLWNRGQQPYYKSIPRHRTQTVFY